MNDEEIINGTKLYYDLNLIAFKARKSEREKIIEEVKEFFKNPDFICNCKEELIKELEKEK